MFLHLILLHTTGSSNPTSDSSRNDNVYVSFYPYFYNKDIFGFLIFFFIYSYFIFFDPNYLGHPDNYIEANPMVTPLHIVPEWYFLPFYAMLRSIPNKLGGVVCMGASIIVLFIIPFYKIDGKLNSTFDTEYQYLVGVFLGVVILLGWLGSCPAEGVFVQFGQ